MAGQVRVTGLGDGVLPYSPDAHDPADATGNYGFLLGRQYTLRFSGRYEPAELREFVLDWRDGRPVKLGDVAQIQITRGEQVLTNTQNGNPAISIRIDKENDANALQTLNQVKSLVEELNAGPVRDR